MLSCRKRSLLALNLISENVQISIIGKTLKNSKPIYFVLCKSFVLCVRSGLLKFALLPLYEIVPLLLTKRAGSRRTEQTERHETRKPRAQREHIDNIETEK